MPEPGLLRRPTLRREAQSTSALEGTFAPLQDVLAAVSTDGDWDRWITFFAAGLEASAIDTERTGKTFQAANTAVFDHVAVVAKVLDQIGGRTVIERS